MSISPLRLMWWHWDPRPDLVYIPWLERPIMWYGVLFVLGFVLGYWMFIPLLMSELRKSLGTPESTLRQEACALTDRLLLYVLAGTLVGARLGHVFFYNWPTYRDHWLDIFKIWEGGLASHGGTAGILLALMVFRYRIAVRYPTLTFVTLIDLICIPTALAACCIRLGNFVNQEILGYPSLLPWAVIFGHPADGSLPEPRHPVQLYEAAVYLTIFLALLALRRYYRSYLPSGAIGGIFFLLVFGSRIILEQYKAPLSQVIDESYWTAGQYLSLPFLALGVGMLVYAYSSVVIEFKERFLHTLRIRNIL